MIEGLRVLDFTSGIAGPYCSKRSVTDGHQHLVAAADVVVNGRPREAARWQEEHPRLIAMSISPFGGDGPWAGRPCTEFTLQAACGSMAEAEDHPVTGRHELPTTPFRYSDVPAWLARPAPTLGQHNDEFLSEVATAEELAGLRSSGAIGDRLAPR